MSIVDAECHIWSAVEPKSNIWRQRASEVGILLGEGDGEIVFLARLFEFQGPLNV
jgi:hypothetical protein